MNLRTLEEIGEETHETVDQFFRFEKGTGVVVIDGKRYTVRNGIEVVVPAGSRHNAVRASRTSTLKLYTVYSPPEHKDKAVRRTKAAAEAEPEEYD
jgi:mannose-6-phosphate isomerase-like protein (cupin superfamily)